MDRQRVAEDEERFKAFVATLDGMTKEEVEIQLLAYRKLQSERLRQSLDTWAKQHRDTLIEIAKVAKRSIHR